ncbi:MULTISPECIES: head GIN domain-containing protein [unclassified Paraflavitalea]|uniref:head GIN domain-containing protein n=1 Tax=unclassified Paraflavitalea TaxID=2798305 RepID=UPI003D34DA36
MKSVVFALVGMFTVAVASAQKVINDPNIETRKVSGSFHAIRVSNSVDLYLSQANEEAVAVSATDVESRNRIKTDVVDGVLKIYIDAEHQWWKQNGKKKFRAYVSVKSIDKLVSSGASDVYVSGVLKGEKLNLELSGASDFKGSVDFTTVDANISGASDIEINGKVNKLKVEASGASDFKGFDLTADECDVQASGASDIKITVNEIIDAHASGASDIRYKGNAKIRDIKASGASSVRRA